MENEDAEAGRRRPVSLEEHRPPQRAHLFLEARLHLLRVLWRAARLQGSEA